jgi:ferredoxin
VVILGVPCTGVIDLSKVEKLVGKDRDELNDIAREGDKVIIRVNGKKKEFPSTQVLFDHCLACELPTPKEYDILLGEPTPPILAAQERIEKLKQMTPEQRWGFWEKELSRCIRCYACRNVCPACFCQRCFVEETEPQWVLPAPRWQDNLIFQITRNIHVAGRCTDCGECERACPVNIPLRSLTREMYDIVGELFQFKAGMDKDALPLMTHYEEKEAEDFFR